LLSQAATCLAQRQLCPIKCLEVVHKRQSPAGVRRRSGLR